MRKLADIQQYLKAVLQLHFGEKQQAYFQWQLANSVVVPIVPTAEVIPHLARRLGRLSPQIKLCYANAVKVCKLDPEIQYVLGYVDLYSIPIDHAWNSYRGKHFDVTQELLDSHDEHTAIISLPAAEGIQLFNTHINGVTPLMFEAWRERAQS